MITLETTILIKRPQQEIFDYVADPANAHKWQSQFLSIEWTSEGPHGVGSTQRSLTRFLGRDIEATSQFTVWDPPNQQRFKVVDGPLKLEGGMKFEPQGHSTKVTMEGQMDANGFFKLAERLLKKQIERQFATNLEALKLLLEEGTK
jgi:uncharacterized membrane protein